MKRILITGAHSYLGENLARALTGQGMDVTTLDVHQPPPPSAFCGVDTVIHVAGLVHRPVGDQDDELYDRVNRQLAVQCALIAKEQGVAQFIFFSSMSVYGLSCGAISSATLPAPNTPYGKSKWAAEQELSLLRDDQFHLAILRPPMIYGAGCKGNYPRLRMLALRCPLFPKVQNQRSVLHVDQLCSYVAGLIQSGEGGLFFPQNHDYASTDELVTQIAAAHGKRVILVPGFGWLLQRLAPRVSVIGKLFGSLTYDKAMSPEKQPGLSLAQTIALTEADV